MRALLSSGLRHQLLLLLVWQYLTVQALPAAGQHIQLVKEPASLVIPSNENGTFSCKALCDHLCLRFWLINDSVFEPEAGDQRMHLERHGDVTIGFTLTLTVNASQLMNNTRMGCRFEATGVRYEIVSTRSAVLFVVSEPPEMLTSNPSIIRNATHATLMWSPPFLWPGHRIEYFNVSVTNNSNTIADTTAVYYLVNDSSYYDATLMIYPVNVPIGTSRSLLSCNNLTFHLSAIEKTNFELLQQTFTVSDWTWILPSSELTPSVFNTSVLFKADGTPALVKVYVQLPVERSNCDYKDLNFTLVFEREEGDLVTEVPVTPHIYSGVIEETVTFEFGRNQRYSLRVTMEAYSQKFTTTKYYFNTCQLDNSSSCKLHACTTSKGTTDDTVSALLYKGLSGIFVVLSALLMFVVVMLIACLCIHRRKVKKEMMFNELKGRVCNTMVHNPIYDHDGECDCAEPVYDTVQNHPPFNSAEAKNSQLPVYNNFQPTTNCESALEDDQALNVVRYVDQPSIQLCGSSLVHNSTSNCTCNSMSSKSSSISAQPSQASRNMALKKNGQERNKLHLTLSLGERIYSQPTKCEDLHKSLPKSCDIAVDETYTEMRPAGSLLRAASKSRARKGGEQSLHRDTVL